MLTITFLVISKAILERMLTITFLYLRWKLAVNAYMNKTMHEKSQTLMSPNGFVYASIILVYTCYLLYVHTGLESLDMYVELGVQQSEKCKLMEGIISRYMG